MKFPASNRNCTAYYRVFAFISFIDNVKPISSRIVNLVAFDQFEWYGKGVKATTQVNDNVASHVFVFLADDVAHTGE